VSETSIVTSVIIPAYNCAGTIAEAIDSVTAQQAEGVEIIVVDDGSTDETPRLLEKYGDSIRVIHQTNGGLCAARNAGLAVAKGEFIALLDADDVWLGGRLERTVSALARNPRAVLAFCDYISIRNCGTPIASVAAGRAPSHMDFLQRGWPIVPSAVTIRRSALDRVHGFCEEFKGAAGGEDQYMWLMLSESGDFEYVAASLVRHRRDPAARLVEKYEAGRQTFIRLARQRYGGAAEGCIRESSGYFAGLCMAAASEELEAGNLGGALRMMGRALRYRPLAMLNRPIAARLFRVENFRRLARSIRGRAASEAAK
jgi:glycosyltransferase involved in cell wall biosynthesis